MATNHSVLAEALDRMAVQQEAIVEAAKAFREIGSLDQALSQRREQLAQIDLAIREEERRLEELAAAAKHAIAERKAADEVANLQANATLAAAREKADELTTAAEAQATALRADAAKQANGIVDRAQAQAKQAQYDAAAAAAEANAARKARDEAAAELEALNTKLSEARAKLRELIGE